MPTTITRTSLLAMMAVAVAIAVIFAAGAQLALADQDQAPTGLTLTATDANTVQATWTAHPDGARDYRLSWAPHDENFKTWTDTDWNAFPTGNSYTITGLEGGSTYKVKVRARFETGPPSDWSGIVTATTTAPPEPTPAPTPQPTPEPTPDATPEPAIDYDQERNASVSLGDITNAAVDNRDETVDTDDPVDYFHFSLTHQRTVGLRIRRLDYNADLYVEDNDGTVIASSENGGDQKEVLNLTLAATGANEYYYVRVEAKEDGRNDYQLRYFTDAPPNAAATGAPTISGAAQVRETLSAGVSGIADDNGLSNASFDYQWVRSVDGTDTDITSATGSTFLLTYDEHNHTIRVRVSFTDDAGYPETLTSDATATVLRPPNASPGGRPAVSGILAVGKTLTADTSGITDPNGLSNPGFTHQWVRVADDVDTGIAGATGPGYTLASGDEGAAFKVTVAFTDDGYAETLTSDPTEVLDTENSNGESKAIQPRAAGDATGAPTISGTAQVGETLTASTSGITDPDGLTSPGYTYQWMRVNSDGANPVNVGTDSDTYTPVADDVGKRVRVRVTFTDDADNAEILTSEDWPSQGFLPGALATLVIVAEKAACPDGHVWCAELTIGEGTSGSTTIWGYDAGSGTGELDDTDFIHAGTTYEFSEFHFSVGSVSNELTIALDKRVPRRWIFGLDDLDYTVDAVSEQSEIGIYAWTASAIHAYVLGQKVTVSLLPLPSLQNLRATTVAYASVTLEWDEPDPRVTHVRIVRTGGNLPDNTIVEALTGSRDNHPYALLEPDTGYTFTVKFGTSATEFGPAATINVRTLPVPAPTNVRVDSQATVLDTVRVILKWDNPAETLFLESSIAVYDATLQIEEYFFNDTDLREKTPLNIYLDLDTTYNFATWYRTEDASGAFHEGPKAYLEITTARLPEVSISISDGSVEEGGTLTFTLTITDFADRRTGNVAVTAAPRTGESEFADYTSDPGHLTYTFSTSQSTRTVELTTVDDDLYEGDETFTVELINPTGGLTIGRATAAGTIIDNDPLPLLSPLDATIPEDDPELACIRSEPAAEQPFDVALSYSGTATPGADYTGVNTLTLAGGNTLHCDPFMIIDDNIYEGDETIIYTLQEEPGSYRVDPADKTATITIRENDPVPSLTVTAFPGVEGGRNQGNTPVQGQEFGNVVFRFNLDRPAAVPISMDLETIDGAAVRGDDYRFNNPTLVFPAGQTEMFIKLPVIDDDDFDGTRNEDFELVASNPSLPVFTGRLRATGYIVDNETPPPGVDYVDDSIRTDAYIDVGESWVNGNAVVGGVEHRYDQDWYRTELRADRCYQIEVRGKDAWEDFQEYPDDDPIQEYAPSQELTLSDPLIHGVYTDLGNYMPDTQEEYGGVGLGAVKLVTIDQTGTVYIAVSHAWYGDDDENEGGGTFDLSLIDLGRGSCTRMDPSVTDAWASITYRRHHSVSEGEGRDLPEDISTTGYVQPDGAPATGNIEGHNDLDPFKTPLIAGRSYRIEAKGNEESDYGGTIVDPWVTLTSSAGAVLDSQSEELTSFTGDEGYSASDNNSGRGLNARLEVEVNITDTYFIYVLHFPEYTGTYTIVVTTIAN